MPSTGSIMNGQKTPYSFTERFQITLGFGDSITFNSSTGTPPSAPEPSSMAIASTGGLGLLGYGLRRRKALAARAQPS